MESSPLVAAPAARRPSARRSWGAAALDATEGANEISDSTLRHVGSVPSERRIEPRPLFSMLFEMAREAMLSIDLRSRRLFMPIFETRRFVRIKREMPRESALESRSEFRISWGSSARR